MLTFLCQLPDGIEVDDAEEPARAEEVAAFADDEHGQPVDERLFDTTDEEEEDAETSAPSSLADAKPPRQALVPDAPAITPALKQKMLLCKFDPVGWMVGTIQKHYKSNKKYNVECRYEGDPGPRDQFLDEAKYSTDDAAPLGSWCLLTDP